VREEEIEGPVGSREILDHGEATAGVVEKFTLSATAHIPTPNFPGGKIGSHLLNGKHTKGSSIDSNRIRETRSGRSGSRTDNVQFLQSGHD